jgi:hypothetical protein
VEDLTLTSFEKDEIIEAVDGFNATILDLTTEFEIPVVDVNGAYDTLNTEGIDGFTELFVLDDPLNTAFSLYGIHPNNGGQAITANLFIEAINESFGLNIPLLDTEQFRGQYVNTIYVAETSINAIREVIE